MRHSNFFYLLFFTCWLLTSCDAIIEPSISKSEMRTEAPVDNYQSISYKVNFWWDEVNNALSYRLQVVTPNFASPGSLVLDTLIKTHTFSFNFNPGIYQWRVLAANGSSQTVYSTLRNFSVLPSSIKQQSIQLSSPANNFLTNQNSIIFQWGSLYGASGYQFELDTNNFTNENFILSTQTVPSQQLNFTFPKDHYYQWRVRATNDTAQSLWSPIYSVSYDHTPPLSPTIVSPANNQIVSLPVNLQWTAPNSALHYKLYVFKNDSTSLLNATFPLTTNTNSYSFNFDSSGNRIYWKVSAIDAAGNESSASTLNSFVLQ